MKLFKLLILFEYNSIVLSNRSFQLDTGLLGSTKILSIYEYYEVTAESRNCGAIAKISVAEQRMEILFPSKRIEAIELLPGNSLQNTRFP
jgi:hypothetical protein